MPNNYSTNIVYLSKAQYQELIANQTITVNGTTVTYNENDIYVTPQAEPITDVRANDVSISSNGVANIPIASINAPGLIQLNSAYGFSIMSNTLLKFNSTSESFIKSGTSDFRFAGVDKQHMSVFYGLSKLAGVDLANETVTLGTYPDTSKAAIQNMLGITGLLSTEESSTATAAHALNSTFMMNGKLHRATAAIAIGDAVEVGTNCEVVKADEVFVKYTDYATTSTAGLIKIRAQQFTMANGQILQGIHSSEAEIKAGITGWTSNTTGNQHLAVFYGLSKVAGVDLANETVTLGTYPETSKAAIRTLIDAGTPLDVQINGTSIVSNGVANIPVATTDIFGAVKIDATKGITIQSSGKLAIYPASVGNIKSGDASYMPITTDRQHNAVFYGLAKAAGDETQSVSTNAVGTYTSDASAAIRSMLGAVGDVQVNGTSVVSNEVANIPAATTDIFGVVKPHTNSFEFYQGSLRIKAAAASDVKEASNSWKALTPYVTKEVAFYGLAKAAGDTTQSTSSNTVGTYTSEAKAAIHTMLGIDPASIAAQVDIPLVETVSGTTPSITGQPNVRYVCGEVSTISITPPASGSVDVIFESGSTATVLTVPNTVKWPAWFDATTLEADTTYEILITDGIYGSVMTWAT